MLGLYTPLLLLQAFCVYHAYKNNAEQRWYWLIILFPLVGCVLYIYHHFYNQNNLRTLTQSVKEVVNSNHRIEQLEKTLDFADNVSNKTNLADAYASHGRYKDAIGLYRECLGGFMADDPVLRMKLLQAYFLDQDYDSTIAYGNDLKLEKSFKDSEGRMAYAWALHYKGQSEVAEGIFQDMDRSFTNYKNRLEYCKFLKDTNKVEALKTKLTELVEEFDHMEGSERRLYRDTIREIREMHAVQIRVR
jgi:hypothetical protein